MKQIQIPGKNFPIFVYDTYEEASLAAAEFVAAEIKKKPDFLLGLATGSTPVGLYRALIEKNKKGEIDFSKVKTYNLDEYYPISPRNEQSFLSFMKENLFDHINLKPENVHIPCGEAPDPNLEAEHYEKELLAIGGVDLQVLGIGSDGHIGFNEPDDAFILPTHLVTLTEQTISDNARFFPSKKDVPTHALTMGIGAIMRAKKCILIANGKNKARAIREALLENPSPANQASILQFHRDVTFFLDHDAASEILSFLQDAVADPV